MTVEVLQVDLPLVLFERWRQRNYKLQLVYYLKKACYRVCLNFLECVLAQVHHLEVRRLLARSGEAFESRDGCALKQF